MTNRKLRIGSWVGSFLFAGMACGGGPAGDLSQGDASILAGTFQVTLVAPDSATGAAGYTSLVGRVSDGATPSSLQWTVVSTVGDCQLLKPRVPFCSTPCGSSAVCVADNTCQPYPKTKSVGSVRASGFTTGSGSGEFELQQVAGSYQPPAGTSLPFPAFAEGAELTLRTSGGDYAAMSLVAAGIAPLTITSGTLQLAPGQGARLTWTPAKLSGSSKIQVKLDISHHGGTKGMIRCETADSGALDLAAAQLTELINLGTAGYPTIVVSRQATPGTAVIAPGRVELAVTSTVEQAVVVPGVTSCTSNTECTGGKTCQSDLTCK